ncbi:MAG: glycosyltransferase family 2 protein [Prevotella sp.]|nr:glycosyltransferase family 2 protein [Prevotella sp.]
MEISVIIPLYNKEPFIKHCLEQTLSQDFDSFEVIAVDDGSTDSSGVLCDRAAAKDHRLRVVHTENGGVTAARRTGLERATGKYVMFLDADDELLPNALRQSYDLIVSQDVDEVIALYQNQNGDIFDSGYRGVVDYRDIIKNYLGTKNSFQPLWGILFRKELLEGCLNFTREIIIGEDILTHIRALVKQPRIFCADHSNYLYVQGLPNTRKKPLRHEMTYDQVLRESLQPLWPEIEPWYQLHQLKAYEVFIDEQQFHVYKDYYHSLKGHLNPQIPLLDRMMFALPPRAAYLPIHLYKKWLRMRSRQIFTYNNTSPKAQ